MTQRAKCKHSEGPVLAALSAVFVGYFNYDDPYWCTTLNFLLELHCVIENGTLCTI